jgi:predicted nuclease of predicted toxin-antitoxin system
VRFLADMGMSITTLQALRAAGHDAVHLLDEGLIRLPDPEIAAKCRESATLSRDRRVCNGTRKRSDHHRRE